eukprot:CAMPEP_0196999922 /NCGR_PEP_ID=MMETSP1380-20130617/5003_1 /TAXON_ID=5936 /ORGANISM="Euplotes crassus, Strain CT5" /LENGTH=196 /DNA_ID=CAMNT_0042417043 /DNA_START=565 /DNA_END=1152 /DNA_ORIENTATION=-
MTTVGYGDFYPMTYLGRSIGVTACYLGTFLISLAIVSLTISLEFEPTQARAYKNAIRYHQKSLNRKYAATLIQACYKYRFYMSKNHDVSLRTKAEKTYFIKKAIKNFKDQRLRIREMEFTLRTDEMYQQINDKINSDFDKLVIDSKVITNCEELFRLVEKKQNNISAMVNEIMEIGEEARLKIDDFKDEQFIDQYL